jgi:hypothetical protein
MKQVKIEIGSGAKAVIRVLNLALVAWSYMIDLRIALALGVLLLVVDEVTEFAPVRIVGGSVRVLLEGFNQPHGELNKKMHKSVGNAILQPRGDLALRVIPATITHRGYVARVKPGDFTEFVAIVEDMNPPLTVVASAARLDGDVRAAIDRRLAENEG